MDVGESLRMSVRTIRGHKLRSVLTTLGIVIGIAAVITFVTLGVSLKAEIVGEFSESGANSIFLLPAPSGEGGGFGFGAQAVFTEHDLAQLRAAEGVRAVVPVGSIPVSAVGRDNESVATSDMTATSPAQFDGAEFAAGGPFTERRPGLVVNREAARQFPGNLSVGDEVTVTHRNGSQFDIAVVGILANDTSVSGFGGFGSGPSFYLPTEYYDQVVESPSTGESQRVYPQVTVVAENPGEIATVKDRVQRSLASSDAAQLVPQGYEISARTNEDIVERIGNVVDRLTQFVTGIAVISLLVGAIGIANIMLVSVRERTREIGIMKAVGATNRDVLQLFLVEATLLGLLGALVGTPLGVLGGYIVTQYADLPLTLAYQWFALAIGIGVLVGIVAGLYPAWSAARVDPIDALRYE
ncbi:ABC transporter permease [Halorientalis brevis]|uniref:ABC transporter permease n=1 Tax=Halorientalis brevis TaxID=1126241 RepID=A0ABD6CF41_9EURY|nr:ABC transporter permease [Halorientalis brevis]